MTSIQTNESSIKHDRLRRFLRCFAPTAGLRDAIMLGYVKEYFAFKRYFRTQFHADNARAFTKKLAICAIIKDEGRYLAEWIEYHKLVGVDTFILYNNDSTDDTKSVLAPYIAQGDVIYTEWSGQRQQNAVYNAALKQYRQTTQWIAYIDADEFIVPIAKPSVPAILADYQNEVGLSMHWLMYGDNGLEKYDDRLVMERFTAHAPAPDVWLKTIVNPRAAFAMENHHGCFIGNRAAVNESGQKVRSRSDARSAEKIRLNHYWGKTWEEYSQKRARGRAGTKTPILPADRSLFDERNRNEVQDDLLAPFIARVRDNIKATREAFLQESERK